MSLPPIGWGIKHRWVSSVQMGVICLSLSPVPDTKSRMEGHRKLKIGRKEAHDVGDLRPRLDIFNTATPV